MRPKAGSISPHDRQLGLPLREHPRWGGRRKGAGRPPVARRRWGPRVPRPAHAARHPVHVTLRARREVGSLRTRPVFLAARGALSAAAASAAAFRVIHFSVQGDHVHLLIEANDARALSRGMQGLAIRLARAINATRGRTGRVWADRYHARALRTPREVRHALGYVLTNWRKHGAGLRGAVDPCSSGRWFDGWKGVRIVDFATEAPPVAAPHAWLLRAGWRRHGPIRLDETPRGADVGR